MEYLYNMENLYDGVLYNKDCFVKVLSLNLKHIQWVTESLKGACRTWKNPRQYSKYDRMPLLKEKE